MAAMSWLNALTSLQFLQPLALWALAVLPLLWWLLRLTPPAPERQSFPALMLLRDLAPVAQSPARTPWWLLLLRLLLLVLLFFGLARPVITPDTRLPGSDLLVVLVDNGWAAADGWSGWQTALNELCQQAEREQRDLLVIPTAPEQRSGVLVPLGPAPALTLCPSVAKLQPRPWPNDHQASQTLLADKGGGAHPVIWFSDGLRGDGTQALYNKLQATGLLTLYQDERPRLLLQPSTQTSTSLTVSITRADATAESNILVTAQDKAGQTLGMAQGRFKAREKTITVTFDLSTVLRNRTAKLVLQDSRHAGGVWLLDGRSARHSVGLIGDEIAQREQPLLNGLHYLERALNARHDVVIGSVETLLAQKTGMIVNTNEGALLAEAQSALVDWLKNGGVLVQFAGNQLDPASPFLPTPLRQSRRDLGGVLSWEKPQALRAFPANGPFAGLAVPDDVTISQQILADPTGLTGDTSWALLQDGTPLVTGKRIGRGTSVLFHVPATPGWSSLPLSGLFVQLLERLTELASTGGSVTASTATLPANTVLDGFGQLQPAGAAVAPLTPPKQTEFKPVPEHPPGYYGAANNLRAFNLGQGIATLLPFAPETRRPVPQDHGSHELRPWLLAAALALFLADLLLALLLRGLVPLPRSAATLFLLGLLLPGIAQATTDTEIAASEKIWLGHVVNGSSGRSAVAATGLTALAERVRRKTSVDKIGVLPVDLESDDLSLIALLYWPLTDNPALSATAQRKLQEYFAHGGMLLLDLTSEPEDNLTLRESGIALPMLAPVTAEHTLMRTFYLLRDCPGRTLDGKLWSERDVAGRQDNVPAIFIGARDWASAWASGGGNRQDEMALRCGLNLVLYALTGNYKMDQVHVGTILERLGR